MAADRRGLCIGLDVGTSGVKAVADRRGRRRRGERRRRLPAAHAAARLDRAGARRVVAGELRCPAAAGGEGAGQDRGDRPHGPDARCRVPGWRRQGDPPGDPVERPAHRGRMRRDRARGRFRAAAPDRGQPRAHRLPGAQGAVAAPQRAGSLRKAALAVAAKRFHPLSADRRARERCLRCRRHAAARPRGARLVGRDSCRARHPARLAAAGLRGPGGDRPGVGCGCRGDRPAPRACR